MITRRLFLGAAPSFIAAAKLDFGVPKLITAGGDYERLITVTGGGKSQPVGTWAVERYARTMPGTWMLRMCDVPIPAKGPLGVPKVEHVAVYMRVA